MIFPVRNWLPNNLKAWLWGDRDLFGSKVKEDDLDWKKWKKFENKIYLKYQKKNSLGKLVSSSGYKFLKKINLENKNVLEIGPGELDWLKYINSKPKNYTLIDCSKSMILISEKILKKNKIKYKKILVNKYDNKIPVKNNSQDIVLSFNCLEHIYNLDTHTNEIRRVLKKNGLLIGAIPTEGGFLWGFGRAMTTQRTIKQKYNLNYNKIICWEHVNFCDKVILKLDKKFKKIKLKYWPFSFLPFDLNLTKYFIYKK